MRYLVLSSDASGTVGGLLVNGEVTRSPQGGLVLSRIPRYDVRQPKTGAAAERRPHVKRTQRDDAAVNRKKQRRERQRLQVPSSGGEAT
jgi:hypothetical protein